MSSVTETSVHCAEALIEEDHTITLTFLALELGLTCGIAHIPSFIKSLAGQGSWQDGSLISSCQSRRNRGLLCVVHGCRYLNQIGQRGFLVSSQGTSDGHLSLPWRTKCRDMVRSRKRLFAIFSNS